MGINYLRW